MVTFSLFDDFCLNLYLSKVENATEADFSPEHQDTIGDDVLQMALKMASDFGEPAADFGGTVAPTSVSKSRPSRAVEGKDGKTRNTITSSSLCILYDLVYLILYLSRI